MKLIIESGATKADWALLLKGSVQSFQTEGLNFSSGDEEFVFRVLEQATNRVLDITDAEMPEEVNLYAAGLFPSEEPGSPYRMLKNTLSTKFPGAEIHLENDLLAAARAVLGHESGISVILGTGSNTCEYDGEKIVRKVSSGGFILGDEGSAAALGRAFISDFIKGLVPECVARAFEEKYDMSYPEIVRNVYRGNSPSGYLGHFAPDILSYYGTDHYMQNLVDENFRLFFARCIKPFNAGDLPVGVVGGFGYACRDILTALGSQDGITFSTFLASPSEALIKYHC